MQFLSYLINGISLGSVYALIALGYTMVYGIAKMLNFAHGDVIMIGSYVVFFAFGSAGMNPVLAIVLSMVVCTVLGVTIERVAYRPLREAPSLAVLITAIELYSGMFSLRVLHYRMWDYGTLPFFHLRRINLPVFFRDLVSALGGWDFSYGLCELLYLP